MTIEASMSSANVTDFTVAGVLARGLAIAGRKAAPFGLVTLIVTSPSYIIAAVVDSRPWDAATRLTSVDALVIAVESVLIFVASAILCHATIRELRAGESDLGESLRWSLRVMGPVLGIAVLCTAATWAGLVLFIVPGLFLLTIWWVVVPVAVVEQVGVVESLARSFRLTDGYRWRVFGVLAVVYATFYGLGMLGRAIFPGDGFGVASYLAVVVLTVVDSVVAAVGYHDLRTLKEGPGVGDIAGQSE